MPLPEISDDAERLLLTIHGDFPLVTTNGMLAALLAGRFFNVSASAIGELEERGWIAHEDAVVCLTDNGRYWADRFAKRRFKKGGM
jgi:hypothetical protein